MGREPSPIRGAARSGSCLPSRTLWQMTVGKTPIANSAPTNLLRLALGGRISCAALPPTLQVRALRAHPVRNRSVRSGKIPALRTSLWPLSGTVGPTTDNRGVRLRRLANGYRSCGRVRTAATSARGHHLPSHPLWRRYRRSNCFDGGCPNSWIYDGQT